MKRCRWHLLASAIVAVHLVDAVRTVVHAHSHHLAILLVAEPIQRTAMAATTAGRGETGRSGRPANLAANLGRLLEALMEPAGRQARRRATEAVRRAA